MQTKIIDILGIKSKLSDEERNIFLRQLFDFEKNQGAMSDEDFISFVKSIILYAYNVRDDYWGFPKIEIQTIKNQVKNKYTFMVYNNQTNVIVINKLFLDDINHKNSALERKKSNSGENKKYDKYDFIDATLHEFNHFLQFKLMDLYLTNTFTLCNSEVRRTWAKDIENLFFEDDKNMVRVKLFLRFAESALTDEEMTEFLDNLNYRFFLINQWNYLSNRKENGGIKQSWVTADGKQKNINDERNFFAFVKSTIDQYRKDKSSIGSMIDKQRNIIIKYVMNESCFSSIKLAMAEFDHVLYLKKGLEEDSREESMYKMSEMLSNIEKEEISDAEKIELARFKQKLIESMQKEVNARVFTYSIVDAILAEMKDLERKRNKILQTFSFIQDEIKGMRESNNDLGKNKGEK